MTPSKDLTFDRLCENLERSGSAAPQHGLRQTCQIADPHRHLPWDRNIKRLEGGV